MKSRDDSFTTELGKRMEKYMEQGLEKTGIKFLNETTLKKTIGEKNNLVDFVIEGEVLVEAKAIELKPFVGINPEDEILANEFRKNIVKAYSKQMLNVASKLNDKKEYFGIIVTYKKLFLGDSADIWEQFLKIETLKNQCGESIKILPVENLFFLDIDSWDFLLQLLKEKKLSLVDVLKKARKTNSDPTSKKYTFSMILDEYKINNLDFDFLNDAYNEIKL